MVAPVKLKYEVTHLAEGQRAVRVLSDDEGVITPLEHRLQVIHVHHRHHHVREGRPVDAVTHPHPQRELGEHTRNQATNTSTHITPSIAARCRQQSVQQPARTYLRARLWEY